MNTNTAPAGYVARRKARQSAKWTLGELRPQSNDARQQHHEARSYARIAASLAGPLPAGATERDAMVYILANRALEDYGDKFLAAKKRRLDLIRLRRHARATLAAIRWTAADQRRQDREDEAQEAEIDARAWRDTYSRAYGDD